MLYAATIPGATKPGMTIKEVNWTATRNVFGDDCDVCNFAARYLAGGIISSLPGRPSSALFDYTPRRGLVLFLLTRDARTIRVPRV